jgi:heavy metal sensor kinase
VSLRPSSIRVRLTLWYSLALACIVLVFFLVVFFFVKASLFGDLNARLESDFKAVSRALLEEPNETPEIETESAVRMFQIVKAGKLFYQTPAFEKSGLPPFREPAAAGIRPIRVPSGARFRLKTDQVNPEILLTVAADEGPAWSTLRRLMTILLLSLPIALALAGLGGFVMAGRLLQPVSVIAAKAGKISAESLSARLPVENSRDEFGRLAGVINVMLSRLEDSFDRLRRFTADASHELRTPLTVIRSVGEVALQEDLDVAAYRDRIGSMLEGVNRLTRLIENLLTLTRADGGHVPLGRTETDMTRLVERTAEDMRALAEEKDQKLILSLKEPAVLRIDEATVRLALVNLLDNAIKYTPPTGTVTIGSRILDSEFFIEVTDTGPGIQTEHRDRIFDRFYRVDKDRSGQAGGAGLGLSIAKWAVEVNGGRIELEIREGPGSTFALVFPVDKST